MCLLLGGRRHFEQRFELRGASAALAVLGTLAGLTLILPNFTLTAAGPYYAPVQLVAIGAMSLLLWGVFVFVQTIRHRDYFLEAPRDTHEDDPADRARQALGPRGHGEPGASAPVADRRGAAGQGPVLSARQAVAALDLPKAFVGVVIAAVVLLPEGLAAANSALHKRLQNSINLAIGSAIASIGLTIPAVAVVALLLQTNIVLGISPANMTLLVLTFFVSTLTLGTGRTTVLQGAVHLVLFAAFLLVSAVP